MLSFLAFYKMLLQMYKNVENRYECFSYSDDATE